MIWMLCSLSCIVHSCIFVTISTALFSRSLSFFLFLMKRFSIKSDFYLFLDKYRSVCLCGYIPLDFKLNLQKLDDVFLCFESALCGCVVSFSYFIPVASTLIWDPTFRSTLSTHSPYGKERERESFALPQTVNIYMLYI